MDCMDYKNLPTVLCIISICSQITLIFSNLKMDLVSNFLKKNPLPESITLSCEELFKYQENFTTNQPDFLSAFLENQAAWRTQKFTMHN